MARVAPACIIGGIGLLTLLPLLPAAAAGTAAVEAGRSWADEVAVRRVSLARYWGGAWALGAGWRVRPLWALSAGRLRPMARVGTAKSAAVYQAGLRLLVRLLAARGPGPFLEAGTGPVYLTDDAVGDHKLGSRLQFRSHAGVGVLLGPGGHLELAYAYSHTSNAHLGWPNPGINFHTLRLGVAF